jgi:hypothetical protein
LPITRKTLRRSDKWSAARRADGRALYRFIDQSASLQHLFVDVISIRDKHYKAQVPGEAGKQYKLDFQRVYSPLSIRWA